MKTAIYTIVLSFTIITLAASALAGSLTPPGAPASTMKTLDEVEARTPIHANDLPLTISQPGSYYLAENIEYSGAGDGISVHAADVAIDLNGFILKGPGGTVVSGRGISTLFGTTSNTLVRNGTVTGWPGGGIGLFGRESHAENVHARNNGSQGIDLHSGSVINCKSEYNEENGIRIIIAGKNLISGCKSSHNGADGILLNQSGKIVDNICVGNGLSGINLGLGAKGTAQNNVCLENTLHGMDLRGSDLSITKNTCSQNGGDGINDTGINVSRSNTLTHNICSDNGGGGIVLSSSVNFTINDNNCSLNDSDGISLDGSFSGNCDLKNNNCSTNGSDGIFVDADDCRVESNNVSGNTATGLRMSAASIAVKNTASGNGFNYTLNSVVIHGPVITLNAGDTILSEHPWANFDF